MLKNQMQSESTIVRGQIKIQRDDGEGAAAGACRFGFARV
jgi:hypothetical protein